MQFKKFIFSFCHFMVFFVFMITGCSKPILKMDSSLPPIIKEYKNVVLNAGSSTMKNTGILLNKGDLYLILAKGSIDYCIRGNCRAGHNVRPELGWPLIARVGQDQWFHPLAALLNGNILTTFSSGYLFLGYKQGPLDHLGKPLNPNHYYNDQGAFYVDIIVWRNENWIQIADFLAKIKATDPQNKAVSDAFEIANKHKEILLAEAIASKEIEKTSKEIIKLKAGPGQTKDQTDKTSENKKSSPLPEPPTVEDGKQERVVQLETKLEKLIGTLAKLEEMKKQWEEERKKTVQLSEELEQKEQREKELLDKLANTSKTPPILVIASPQDGKKTEAKFVQLSGVAEDNNGLEKLEILINNKFLRPENGRGIIVAGERFPKRFDFNERVPLEKGSNQIKIRAVDSEGLISEKFLTIEKIEIRRNIWAAIIGINDYKNIKKLKYAVNDAKAFYDLLVNQIKIPPENITLLINQEASLTNLRSTLGTKLRSNAGREDMVIIYFAGHGATEKDVTSQDGDGLEKYLLPYNADPEDFYSTALPMREISYIFRRIRSERLIFIADSCYSGASGGRTIDLSGIRANISDAFLDRIASGKGTVIITASGANEVSAENDKLQHGVFTYYLIEGLRGKADTDNDGLISVDEAYSYVSEQVPRATGQQQHPVKKGMVEGSLILGITQ